MVKREVIESTPRSLGIFFFWAGIIATLAYRVIIILNFYSPVWVKISWYIGTVGFILYFGFRWHVQSKRAKVIAEYNLIEAIDNAPHIKGKQKEALHYVMENTLKSKSKWNSAFIFWLSVLALIVGIVLDFLGI